MSQFGRQSIGITSAFPTRVSADGFPEYKIGGITLEPSVIAAGPTSNVTLPDGSIIVANAGKYLRYGQVLTKISSDGFIVTIDATSGNFTLGVSINGASTVTTGNIAENAAAATVQTALEGLSGVGAGNVTVTGSAGGPFTVTFPNSLGYVTLVGTSVGLTGGAGTITVSGSSGAGAGKYGPYDPAATDGRATLTRGEAFILDQLWMQYPGGPAGAASGNFNIGGVFDGGSVYLGRILHSGTGSASLAAGPTLANLLAVFPRLQPVRD